MGKLLNYKFAHHHLHTEYSPFDAPVSLKNLIARSKELGYKTITVTDHGTVSSWVKFASLCKSGGVKPIFGLEAYFVPDRHVRGGTRNNHHLVMLAKTNEGIKNIFKMSQMAWSDGYYYDPRVDWDLLEKYHDGVICTTACVSGIVGDTLLSDEPDAYQKALSHAKHFQSIFGNDFYAEIQNHGSEIDRAYWGVAKIAKEIGLKTLATNDVHYLTKEQANTQEVMMALCLGKKIKDPKRIRHDNNQMYLKSQDEMVETFGGQNSQAVQSSLEIADTCTAELQFGKTQLPSISIPKEFKEDIDYLESLAWAGLVARGKAEDPVYQARFKEEMSVIRKLREKGKRFDRYFLVVWDYIRWARENGVRVGVGRGSGCGSLMLWCLKITAIDPIPYDLLFERFLDEERNEMPDIDIDFDSENGHKVYEYVCSKYGVDRCARIGTFNTFHVAAAIKAAFRVFDPGNSWEKEVERQKTAAHNKEANGHKGFSKKPIELDEGDETARLANEITKMLPRKGQGPDPNCTLLKEVYEKKPEEKIYVYDIPEFAAYRLQYPEEFKFAEQIEGLLEKRGIHAAGVLITETPLVEVCPQQVVSDKGERDLATAFDMNDVESLGLVKFDFLRTNVLTVFNKALANIEERYGKKIEIDDLIPDDPKAMGMFTNVDVLGIFQFESTFMQGILRQMKCDRFEDVIAANALGRPGPMANIPSYCERKSGREAVVYPVQILSPVLEPTFGIMVYQEQIMRVCRVLAGFTGSQADKIRKAMGKKKRAILDEMKQKFMDGIVKGKTCQDSVAHKLWSEMEKFGEYAFNKSLEENSLIPTKNGNRLLKDCKKGDIVWCYDGDHMTETDVVALHDHGVIDGIEIVFDDGSREICSVYHKFLTINGMKPLWKIVQKNLEVISYEKNPKPVLLRHDVQREKRNASPQKQLYSGEGNGAAGSRQEWTSESSEGTSILKRECCPLSAKTKRRDEQYGLDRRSKEEALRNDEKGKCSSSKEIQSGKVCECKNNGIKTRDHCNALGKPVSLEGGESREVRGNNKESAIVCQAMFGGDCIVQNHAKGYGFPARRSYSLRKFVEASRFYEEQYMDRVGRQLAFWASILAKEVQGCTVRTDSQKRHDVERGSGEKRGRPSQVGLGLLEGVWQENSERRLENSATDVAQESPARNMAVRRIVSARPVGKRHMYDLEVRHPAHNFALSNGVITSNSHSAGYAFTAYQCAWLKAYYPAEFLAAQVSVESADDKERSKYEHGIKNRGIKLLDVDVNLSKSDYRACDSGGKVAVRKGFKSIKGFPKKAQADIEAGQPYKDMYDFCIRGQTGANAKIVEMLMDNGGFNSWLPKLSEKYGKPATKAEIKAEYEKQNTAAKAEKNLKGAAKEELERTQTAFFVEEDEPSEMKKAENNFRL